MLRTLLIAAHATGIRTSPKKKEDLLPHVLPGLKINFQSCYPQIIVERALGITANILVNIALTVLSKGEEFASDSAARAS